MNFRDLPVWGRVRRNHALEHATMHLLTRRNPFLSLVGRSDWRGYSIYGQAATQEVAAAAHEALARLKAGETDLAIHPRCGTMLATTGVLSGLAAFVTLGAVGRPRSRFRWGSLPEVLLAASLAAVVAQPVGLVLQQYLTTSADVGNLQIGRIYKQRAGLVPIHRVDTY